MYSSEKRMVKNSLETVDENRIRGPNGLHAFEHDDGDAESDRDQQVNVEYFSAARAALEDNQVKPKLPRRLIAGRAISGKGHRGWPATAWMLRWLLYYLKRCSRRKNSPQADASAQSIPINSGSIKPHAPPQTARTERDCERRDFILNEILSVVMRLCSFKS